MRHPHSIFVFSVALQVIFFVPSISPRDPHDEITEILDSGRIIEESNGRNKELDARNDDPYKRDNQLPKTGNLWDELYKNFKKKRLYCYQSYPIDKLGFFYFRPSLSDPLPCQIAFTGSKRAKCTVGFLCSKRIVFDKCDRAWWKLYDGVGGKLVACDDVFRFNGNVRIPRANGTDIYWDINAMSSTYCIALCVEDISPDLEGIEKISPLKKDPDYGGLHMEPNCKCGLRQTKGRIVGGENALPYEFPWFASIVLTDPGYERVPVCGAALLTDRHVISAAHCFAQRRSGDDRKPEDIQVLMHHHVMSRFMRRLEYDPDDEMFDVVPGWDLPNVTDAEENSLRLEVEEITVHPHFYRKNLDYDVALLKLKNPINLGNNDLVAPICLPTTKEDLGFKDDETTFTVSGYGYITQNSPGLPRIPQKLDLLPYISYEKCSKHVTPALRHICAGFIEEGGKDSCQGDSGSPLLYKMPASNYILAGIVSGGIGCANPYRPGFYTDIQEVVQWIYNNTKDGKWCHREQ